MSNQDVLNALTQALSTINNAESKGDDFCKECCEEAGETVSECCEEVREHID